MLILHSILRGDHGIARRHFAVPDIDRVFDRTADELNGAFRAEAPEARRRALSRRPGAKAGVAPGELDALLICTCTGYLCPGLTSYVAEQLGLRPNAILHDLVGLGCGAAIPTLRAASHLLAARPGATVACVAVEVCSAAFYLDDDPASSSAPASSATAPPRRSGAAAPARRAVALRSTSSSLHLPAERDKLRFEQRDGQAAQPPPPLRARTRGRRGRPPLGERGPRPVSPRRRPPRRPGRARGARSRVAPHIPRRERAHPARLRQHEQPVRALRPRGGPEGGGPGSRRRFLAREFRRRL
jgi:hypothetical protein